MNKTTIPVTHDLIECWLDSFPPEIKTFTANFVINVMDKADYDPENLADNDQRYFANLLEGHFEVFLKVWFYDNHPGQVLKGISFSE
jgi:hypothetical protein